MRSVVLLVAGAVLAATGRLGFFVRFGHYAPSAAPGGHLSLYRPPLDPAGDPNWAAPADPLLPRPDTAGLPGVLTAPSPSGGDASAPVVTPAGARSIVAAAWSAHGQALAANDENGLAALETGSALEIDLGRCICSNGGDPFGPIGDVSVMVPRQASYPARFMAQVATTVGTHREPWVAFIVFTRADAAAPWRIALQSGFSTKGPATVTPPPVDADGYLVPETLSPKVDPVTVHGLLADYWRRAKDSGQVPAPDPFEPGLWTTDQAEVLTGHGQGALNSGGLTAWYTYQADPDPAARFVFDEGGGWRIACAPVRVQKTITGGPHGFPYQTQDRHNWGRDVAPGVHAAIVDTEVTVPCVDIPPLGSPDGLRVFGADEYTSDMRAVDPLVT